MISKKLKTIYTATTQNLDAAGISKTTPSHTYRNDSFERIALATLRQAQKKKNSNMGCRVLWPIEQKVAKQIFFLVNRGTTTFIKAAKIGVPLPKTALQNPKLDWVVTKEYANKISMLAFTNKKKNKLALIHFLTRRTSCNGRNILRTDIRRPKTIVTHNLNSHSFIGRCP